MFWSVVKVLINFGTEHFAGLCNVAAKYLTELGIYDIRWSDFDFNFLEEQSRNLV